MAYGVVKITGSAESLLQGTLSHRLETLQLWFLDAGPHIRVQRPTLGLRVFGLSVLGFHPSAGETTTAMLQAFGA